MEMPFQILQGKYFTGYLKIKLTEFLFRAIKIILIIFPLNTVMCLLVRCLHRFNQLDLLEISINGADVSELLSLSVGSVLRVDLANKTASPNHLF